MVLRPAVELVARPDRRHRRRDAGGPRARTRSSSRTGIIGKVMLPALVAPLLAFVGRGRLDPGALPDRRAACGPKPVTQRLPRRPGDLRRPAGAGPRHQRRPEDDGRDRARAGGLRHRCRPATPRRRPGWWSSAAAAIALGTYVGGWRIIKTMGSRIHKMDSAQGFAAQGAGAAVILASTARRLPALHHPDDLGRRDRLGRGQAPVGGALGRGGQHRGGVDRHAARRGGHRRAHLRRHAPVRHRRGRAAGRLRC